MVTTKFKAWIHNLMFTKREVGDCSHISIRHIAGKVGGDVASLQVPNPREFEEGENPDARVALFAEELWSKAQDDCEAFQGIQTYAFYSWFPGLPDKYFDRFTTRFTPTVDEDAEVNDDESVSEPANGKGLVQASMRHAEAFARIATQGALHQLSMQQRTIDSQQRMIEKMGTDRLKVVEQMEELASEKHARDLEMKDKEASVKFKTDAMDRVGAFLPIIVSKLTGMPLLTAGGKGVPAIKELLASVTEDQMSALTQILRPEQQALLANMMIEQQNDETKAVQTPNGNGESH